MKTGIQRFVFALVFLLVAAELQADPLDQWAWRFPYPQGYSLAAVAYGGGQFVAVGDNGTIISSSDGFHWTSRSFGVFPYLRSVAYADGEYAAVGDGGVIVVSTNAIVWTQIPLVTSNSLHGIAGDSSCRSDGLPQFLAVGDGGTVVNCSNSTNWSVIPSGNTSALFAVSFATNNVFNITYGKYYLLVGAGGTVTTYFGSGFIQQSQGFTGSGNNLYAVATSGNTLVVGGDLTLNPFGGTAYLTNQILYSLNSGVRWAHQQWIFGGSAWLPNTNLWQLSEMFILTSITCGFNGFVGVGYTGYGLEYHPAVVMTSPNGKTWTEMPPSTSENSLSGVTYGNGLYVAVGDFGSIVVSTNAVNWTEIIPDRRSDILAMACNSKLCVASAMPAWYSWGFSDFSTLVSTNGINWSVSTYNFFPMADLKCSENLFVGVGANNIYTTIDGYNWQTNSTFTNRLYGVANANGLFVVVGNGGGIFTSKDGTNWNDASVSTSGALRGIAYGNGLYVAAGAVAATSTDGVSWSLCPSNPPALITRIVYGKGLFVAAAAIGYYYNDNTFFNPTGGEIMTSPDGVNWQVQLTFGNAISGIAYNGGTFVAISSYGAMFKSSDGTNWIQLGQSLPPSLIQYFDMQDYAPYIIPRYFSTISTFNGTFLAAGAGGNLIQSDNVWNPAFLNVVLVSSNIFNFSYNQQIDVPYRIQSSSNLISWNDLYLGNGSGQATNFVYAVTTNDPAYFFRIISP